MQKSPFCSCGANQSIQHSRGNPNTKFEGRVEKLQEVGTEAIK